jgi:hypothetical protein
MLTALHVLLFASVCWAASDPAPYKSCEDDSSNGPKIDAEATLREWLADTAVAEELPLDTFSVQLVPPNVGTDAECALYADLLRAPLLNRTVLSAVPEIARSRDSVFVARNGDSDGLLVPYNGRCLTTLARRCAELLGANEVDVGGPMQLRSASGFAVRSDEDVWTVAHGLLYVLMDQETWVWPAFKIDFEWTVGAGRFLMRTVSIAPRVIYVTALLSPADCENLIEHARPSLYASPTKDYSDDPAFKNFRTSQTAHIGDDGVGGVVRRRSWFVTRLPVLTCVESTQVVRYGTEKAWFKPHMDVYHNWPGWPEERDKSNTPLSQWVHEMSLKVHSGSMGDDAAAYSYRGIVPSMGDDFQLAMVAMLIEAEPSQIEPEWLEWLRSNHARKSTRLLAALIASKPNVWPVAQTLWLAECSRLAQDRGKSTCPFASADANTETGGVRRPLKRIVPNRHVTVFHYLNDVESGGETVFPRGTPPPSFAAEPARPARPDMPECEVGLAVRPKLGNSVIFYSRRGDMEIDNTSQHGGCPPISGEKWGANSFSWNVDSHFGYSQWGQM